MAGEPETREGALCNTNSCGLCRAAAESRERSIIGEARGLATPYSLAAQREMVVSAILVAMWCMACTLWVFCFCILTFGSESSQ